MNTPRRWRQEETLRFFADNNVSWKQLKAPAPPGVR
jgi:hypothetical protein